MRFDPSRLGIRHQLLGLFGLFLVTGGLVLALDEVGEYYTQRSMSAMKDDVLAGMRSIRRLSDAYSQDVVDSTFRTRNYLIGWDEGLETVERARATAAAEWDALQAMSLQGEDHALLQQALEERGRADRAAAKLSEVLDARDIRALGRFADGELYPAVDPLVERLAAVAAGVSFAKTLITEPGNIIYPESFVERVKAKVEPLGIKVTVLDEKDLKKLGAGSMLGVAQGSVRPPRLLALEWNGTGNADATPLALVGKGVTFDTGGISLKPGPGMEDMKWDMGGAGAVAGIMVALAGRKAKARVVGVCGLVENMPDGNAQRPGDVVTSLSGQTVEVLNTDAEGRLVLNDCLTWTQANYKPKVILDFATLTGAIIISLAHQYAGVFSNSDTLWGNLDRAGKSVNDLVWRQPLSEIGGHYDQMIDSPIADMKNLGPREGGSITAAQFLQRYVNEGVEWAHIDIAGAVWRPKAGALHDKGATGFGVRLVDKFVSDHFES